MKRLLTISRWLHKYLGLLLVLFLMWMSLSGVLMNHPDMISGVSVPGWLVPPQYHIKNWNRSAIVSLVYSQKNSHIAYAAGKEGAWISTDGGVTFSEMIEGLPDSRYYRKISHLWLHEGEAGSLLLAATSRGLYACALPEQQWQPVKLGEEPEPVRKILTVGDALMIFTDSHAYRSKLPPARLHFEQINLMRQNSENRVSLVKLFFDLHDGKAWGLPGKLLFDAVGVVMFFLSLSAFYSWYYPWKRKRENAQKRRQGSRPMRRLFKWFLKYHLKLGIWTAAILLLIGGTGFFMRPPLLAVIAEGSVARSWYPGALPDSPWHEKIQNVLYDAVDDKLVIAATDGLWTAPADFSQPFRELELDVPIFVMGATVFEPYGSGGYLVGSFNGLYHWQRATGTSVDMLTGKEAGEVSSVRPAEKMITGYFQTPQGDILINTHEQGILAFDATSNYEVLQLPESLQNDYRMPLWNYLFEIHNGRFFADVIGKWYILVVPLGSLLFLLITLSGVFDWLYLKLRRVR